MNELTHLDLFSGIGGFALAAQWAGFRTIGFSEVEPYACRVLAERFPGVPNVGDVRQRANFARFRGGVSVLTGGFPCQPWSLAGQQRGTSDHRHLWPAMCRVIETAGPAWVIGENVPGIISVGLESVLVDLDRVGYTAQSFVVPACAVDAEHRRERVWIVAHADRSRALVQGRNRNCENGERDAQAEIQERENVVLGTLGTNCDVAHGHGQAIWTQRGWRTELADGSRWAPEPGICRVAHGVPNRAHRLKGLGNAIVPQVAEQFFRFIAQIERGEVT